MNNKQFNLLLSVFAAAAVYVLGGCQQARRTGIILTPQVFTVETLGYSVENRPIDLYTAGEGTETVLIMAGIHGNEQAGIALTNRLMERIKQQPSLIEERKLLILPVANPDGVVKNTRGNTHGIDLNRNFPAANRENSTIYGFEALSEPESQLLYDLVAAHKPSRIVSIHQPLICIDYDGPAEGLAQFMAAYCTLPVKKLGARPGSFGAYTGEELNTPIITLELERSDDLLSTEQLWQKYGIALIASITYPNHPY